MFSYVLPIGIFPSLAEICLENIIETGALPISEFNFVFLCNNNIKPSMRQKFQDLRNKGYKFDVLECPYDYGYNHMLLLDWAVRHGNLHEWFLIQHCDLFWKKNYQWLLMVSDFIKKADPNYVVYTTNEPLSVHYYSNGSNDFTPYCPSNPGPTTHIFRLDKKDIVLVTDIFALYNKNELLKYNFSFLWGKIAELNFSPETSRALAYGRLVRDKRYADWQNLLIQPNAIIDGSHLIAMECAVHKKSNYLLDMGLGKYYDHWWGLFRIANNTHITGKTLNIRYTFANKKMTYMVLMEGCYSYLCNFLFSISDFEDSLSPTPIPWEIYQQILRLFFPEQKKEIESTILNRMKLIGNHLIKDNSVDFKKLDIQSVNYHGTLFDVKSVIFYI